MAAGIEKKAYKVQPGRFVRAEIGGRSTVCLKAERFGRDFVNHYLVPLDPLPGAREELGLHYIDPAEPLLECEEGFALHLDEAENQICGVGEVVVNPRGTFIKVYDTEKTGRHFAYVDVATGRVLARQERAASAVMRWRLVTRSA